jgi:hypothetical protein
LRYEPRLVRRSGIGGDCSGGYGFPPELDVCDPIDEDIAEIIKTNQNREVRELIDFFRAVILSYQLSN